MSNNPYETPPPSEPLPGRSEAEFVRERVTGPAIGLIVMGVLNALLSVWGVVSSALAMAGFGAARRAEQIEQIKELDLPPEVRDALITMSQTNSGPLSLATSLVALAVALLILVAGLRMKSLRSYGLAVAGSVLVMVPCLSNCCCLGVPLGVWALVVLMSEDVKRGFST